MAGKRGNDGKPAKAPGDELLWLETYFIVFPSSRRPTLAQVERAITQANPRFKLENLAADDDGYFASVLVESPEDSAAVEVSYETGEAVIEQNVAWARQIRKRITPAQHQRLASADARLDVAHYERVQGGEVSAERDDARDERFADDLDDESLDDELAMETFDPTCLLTVVDALAALTQGLTFDPAAGELV
ncbi:MAG: hypothetical protein DCC67_18705 [Planctomycetota bacterium]|nr:MAG: hypothetical protein DCC67_18705 [Planctomycetota bacterium]